MPVQDAVAVHFTHTVILAGAVAIAGCATSVDTDRPVEQAGAGTSVVCPEGRASMCQERMGRPVHCVCAGPEEFNDLIGLERL